MRYDLVDIFSRQWTDEQYEQTLEYYDYPETWEDSCCRVYEDQYYLNTEEIET